MLTFYGRAIVLEGVTSIRTIIRSAIGGFCSDTSSIFQLEMPRITVEDGTLLPEGRNVGQAASLDRFRLSQSGASG